MSDHTDDVHAVPKSGPVISAILIGLVLYGGSLALGLPQKGTEIVVAAASHGHHDDHADHAGADHAGADHAGSDQDGADHTDSDHDGADHSEDHSSEDHADGEHSEEEGHADSGHGSAGHPHAPPVWTIAPFVLLLLCIAILPLIPATEHWWESNTSRLMVAAGLGALTLLYYGFLHESPIDGHWPAHYLSAPDAEGGFQLGLVQTILENAILQEFIPFIVLLFSLYTISGGIRISGDLQANPMTNAIFMGVGALLASFIGTTGAAMLLIRPLLTTNKERKYVVHTVVFFIFIVCNCGGCLLPIGDPPLFLGYLRGVDFFWTLTLWRPWLVCNALLLFAYLLLDELWFYQRETEADITRDIHQIRALKYEGLIVNGILLLGVVAAVALLDPSKTIPGTDWHPWMYLREVVQLSLVGLSLFLGKQIVREENHFNYHAIVEVAALFIGIFVCMQPALQILNEQGPKLGIDAPMAFFWITGGLSSVLDNAPTYVVFFETAKTLASDGVDTMAGVTEPRLIAISLGAVFMGAMTYIGNGPNFMVKAIAEKSGVKMPSFFGYMGYSCCFLLPILAFVAWEFL